MTYAEALKVAIEACRDGVDWRGDPVRDYTAAAKLERLAPFLDAMEKHARGELNYAPMMDAYRALTTEETPKP